MSVLAKPSGSPDAWHYFSSPEPKSNCFKAPATKQNRPVGIVEGWPAHLPGCNAGFLSEGPCKRAVPPPPSCPSLRGLVEAHHHEKMTEIIYV
jgi:hypothetical protein